MPNRAALFSCAVLAAGAVGAASAFATLPQQRARRHRHRHRHRARPGAYTALHRRSPPSSRPSQSALGMVASAPTLPRISASDMAALSDRGYVVVPEFLPRDLVDELRDDVRTLRANAAFKRAKIGQDGTNDLNTDVRIAETCFLGRNRPELASISSAGGASTSVRDRDGGLHDVLDALRGSLSDLSVCDGGAPLDPSLSELLYAYYPRGGFYRRHRDAVPGSASVLRRYSLLLYLNEDGWDPAKDAGQLRLHLDGGGDERPPGVEPKYVDVDPLGGTLVLFKSEMIPHEVLDTKSERFALVGWYNRVVTAGDIGSLGEAGGGGDLVRVGMMAVAMALVTFGVASIIGQ
ncbi:hypothetical protein ACHAWF_015249 [Thalassiosira exigua]